MINLGETTADARNLSEDDMSTSPVDPYDSKTSSIFICNIILIVASTLAVLVRLYVRMRYVSFGWDDCLCVVGWVGSFLPNARYLSFARSIS